MELTVDNLDIEAYEAQKIKPATLVPRFGNELWIVRETEFGTALSPPWSHCVDGDVVRVPLHSYMTRDMDPAKAVAYAFQLGVHAGLEIQHPKHAPSRMHLVLGSPIQEVSGRFKFWLGVAFKMEKVR